MAFEVGFSDISFFKFIGAFFLWFLIADCVFGVFRVYLGGSGNDLYLFLWFRFLVFVRRDGY